MGIQRIEKTRRRKMEQYKREDGKGRMR